ncbi:MAG: right-handed parallel beta-helix repeat-containing protein [bacterium]|nr:right-handed parallel beta-helix repeat-containing protein [bacterium]
MKRWRYGLLLTIALLLSTSLVRAQEAAYYVSPNGDDHAPGTQEQPWRTLQQVQSIIDQLPPGGQILFERGGTYPGSLSFSRSGTAEQPLVLGAYGTGNAPVLSGLTTLTGWVNIGGNRWQSTCPSCASHTDILLLDGRLQGKARYPNLNEGDEGYLYFDRAGGRSHISDDALNNGTNWTGGELVIRSIAWVLDRYPIISHADDTLLLGTPLDDTSYNFEVGHGYFLQNHPAALDQDGEWVYDAATQQITLYLTTDPNLRLLQTSSVESVLRIADVQHIRIQDVAIEGGTDTTVDVAQCDHIELINLQIAYSAQNGLRATDCAQLAISESHVLDHLSNGIMIHDCLTCTISDSIIANIGLLAGMGRGGDGQYLGVEFNGQDSRFERNLVEYIGYNGVRVSGVVVQNNIVRHFALVKVDGGGIYTFDSGNSRIVGNIVMYGLGSTAAIPWGTPAVNGIYLDDDSFNIEVQGNVIGYVGANGIVLHNTRSIRVEDNLIFDAGEAGIYVIDDALGDLDSTDSVIRRNQILNFSPIAPPLHVATSLAGVEWFSRLGALEDNRYCNPLRDRPVMLGYQPEDTDLQLTLDQWQTAYGHDANSEDCGIRLLPYVEVGQPGANRIVNEGIEDWGWWSEQPLEVAWDVQNGGTLRARLPDTTASALIYTDAGETTEGQILRVSFHAQASRSIPVMVYLQQINDPWETTTEPVRFWLSVQQGIYTGYLTALVTEGEQRLTLQFEGAEDVPEVWLHTLAVQPVDAVPLRLEEFAQLVVNTTANPAVVTRPYGFTTSLSGLNTEPGTQINLPPYSGLILLRSANAR